MDFIYSIPATKGFTQTQLSRNADKGALREVQGGALAPPGFCFFKFFINILQFRSMFCMHKVRHRISLSSTERNTAAGIGVQQVDAIQI